MSVIKVSGNTGGTGIFHLRAPNSSTDRFVTLPDVTGNFVTTGDSGTVDNAMISDGTIEAAKLSGGQSGSAPIFGVRAWVNFINSTINGSGNVSSITHHQTGDYTINFTTAMPTQDFAVGGSTKYDYNTLYPYDANESIMALAKGRTDSTGSIRIVCQKMITNPPVYHDAQSVRVIVIC